LQHPDPSPHTKLKHICRQQPAAGSVQGVPTHRRAPLSTERIDSSKGRTDPALRLLLAWFRLQTGGSQRERRTTEAQLSTTRHPPPPVASALIECKGLEGRKTGGGEFNPSVEREKEKAQPPEPIPPLRRRGLGQGLCRG